MTIFVRAHPKIVRLTETYSYETEVSGNPQTDLATKPTGKIEIITPYDGQLYFDQQAIEDVENQTPKNLEQPNVKARIGYLGLIKHTLTNLENRYDLSLHHNVLPVEIFVRGENLQDTTSLRNDRHACSTKLRYTPKWPETNPLAIQTEIFDEDTIKALRYSSEEDQKTDFTEVAKKIAQQTGFKRSLIFAFNLQLALPARVHNQISRNRPIYLKSMTLEWPVATSHRLIHLLVAGKNQQVIYNPERGVIEVVGVPFKDQGKAEGTNLYKYQTPSIWIQVDEPGELYQRTELSGSVDIDIPGPVSGLQLSFFDATGKFKELETEKQTILKTDLTIYLEDCFDRKIFSPYQHLQFEGVILDEMRIADIMTLLQDQRFECRAPRPIQSNRSEVQQYLITCYRSEGPGELTLWILIEGMRSQTLRERQIPGGEKFTTKLNTGHTVIYMRGQLQSDSQRLFEAMNEIQALLKERFRHVRTIE